MRQKRLILFLYFVTTTLIFVYQLLKATSSFVYRLFQLSLPPLYIFTHLSKLLYILFTASLHSTYILFTFDFHLLYFPFTIVTFYTICSLFQQLTPSMNEDLNTPGACIIAILLTSSLQKDYFSNCINNCIKFNTFIFY